MVFSFELINGKRVLRERIGFSVALSTVVVGLVLSGCTSKGEPTTSASVSTTARTAAPTNTETPDAVQENIDDAVAAYRNYVEVRNSVQQDYYRGWQDKVLPLVTGDHAAWVYSYFGQSADGGFHQVGTRVVRSVTLNEYMEDPSGAGTERIILRACEDSTDLQSLDPDGVNQLVPGSTGRFMTTVTMQHQAMFDEQGDVAEDPYGQAWWRVAGLEQDTGSSC